MNYLSVYLSIYLALALVLTWNGKGAVLPERMAALSRGIIWVSLLEQELALALALVLVLVLRAVDDNDDDIEDDNEVNDHPG